MQPVSTGSVPAAVGTPANGGTILVDFPGFILQNGNVAGQQIDLVISVNGSVIIGANTLSNQIAKLVWDGIKWNKTL